MGLSGPCRNQFPQPHEVGFDKDRRPFITNRDPSDETTRGDETVVPRMDELDRLRYIEEAATEYINSVENVDESVHSAHQCYGMGMAYKRLRALIHAKTV